MFAIFRRMNKRNPPGWRNPEGRPTCNRDHQADERANGQACYYCTTPAMHSIRHLLPEYLRPATEVVVCCEHYWDFGGYCIGEHM